MKHCIVCKQKVELQFISDYETINTNQKHIIHVCESCFEEFSEFDNELNSVYIAIGEDQFYPMGLV